MVVELLQVEEDLAGMSAAEAELVDHCFLVVAEQQVTAEAALGSEKTE